MESKGANRLNVGTYFFIPTNLENKYLHWMLCCKIVVKLLSAILILKKVAFVGKKRLETRLMADLMMTHRTLAK